MEIIEGYDAGWLSPDGDFYGLNGSVGNMLHLNIAERSCLRPLWLQVSGPDHGYHQSVHLGGLNQNYRIT